MRVVSLFLFLSFFVFCSSALPFFYVSVSHTLSFNLSLLPSLSLSVYVHNVPLPDQAHTHECCQRRRRVGAASGLSVGQ